MSSNPEPERASARRDSPHTARPAGSVQIGSVGGVPVYLGLSWFLIALVLVVILGPVIGRIVPGIGWAAYGAALLYAILLLLSVFVHEAAHAWMAARFGYRVDRVVADLFGGHTVYQAPDPTPGRMAAVAVVGPASNALVALLGSLLFLAVTDPLAVVLVGAVTWTNAFVAAFNMLPGIPLDGGHVVAATVWKLTGNRTRGLFVAALLGCGLVIAGALWLVWGWWTGVVVLGVLNTILLVLLAVYLWQGSWQALRTTRLLKRLERLDLRALLHPVCVMPADAPVHAVPTPPSADDSALPAVILVVDPQHPTVPVGYLDPDAVHAAWRSGARSAPASSCMRSGPKGWVVRADRDTLTAEFVVQMMNERSSPVLALCDGDGPYAVAEAGLFAKAVDR